jgi:prevent-host-death family protein
MKYSQSIKPISYFKTHAAEIIRNLAEKRETMIITQNGEAKAVMQDIQSYEQTQESLAMLRMLAQSQKSLDQGKYKPAKDILNELKKRIEKGSSE